ncbi:MAG: hypothetical protein Q8O72_14495 [Bacteroidales bacterium]|nr:hypothetical protein [Bacteroidales bacterium]
MHKTWLASGVFFDGIQAGFLFGTPVTLIGGAMFMAEGFTIASDNRHLLFYSDGVTIWNKDHLVIDTGTGLLGYYSVTQNTEIVAKPGSMKKTEREVKVMRYATAICTLGAGSFELKF